MAVNKMAVVNISTFYKLWFILMAIGHMVSSGGCPQKYSESLRFTVDMPKSVLASYDHYKSINCCVSGFTNIVWAFRRSETDNWTEIDLGTVTLDNSNMTIIIKSVKKIHGGFYRCTATNETGSTIKNITELVTGCSPTKPYFEIDNVSKQTSFCEHENGELCCSLTAFTSTKAIISIWLIWSKRVSTNDNYIEIADFSNKLGLQTVTFGKYSIWLNTTIGYDKCLENMIMMTCIEFADLHLNDSGSYECRFEQMDYRHYEFDLFVISEVNNANIYIAIFIMIWILSFIIFAGTWVFYYDLLRIYKKLVQAHVNCLSIDVVLLYDDQDMSSRSIALLISNILSRKGFSTYLYDRDKKYGVDIHKEYLSVMADCNAILFLFTSISLENESLVFCLQNSVRLKEKRIFSFISSRKTVLKSLLESKRNEQICKIVKSSKDYNVWKLKYDKDSFMRRRFISWIISYLP